MKNAAMMVSVVALFLVALLSAPSALAQLPGNCAAAKAEALLDVNNVRARIFNNGPLFWRGEPVTYTVPKDEGVNAAYAYSLWVGGQVNSELRTAAARYNNYEFWPGPLDNTGAPPSDCQPYDHIYEITSEEIATYNASGIVSDNLRDWPWQLGAPVLDGDGVADNYNLEGGDRPALLGDQMFWWVMNDVGNEHESSGRPPIGLEIHGSAFAYQDASALNDITFYRYKLIYKGTSPLTKAWVGFFADNDMGHPWDDNVASDTTLHLGYTYNADNEDEGTPGYGTPPPALGYTILNGPVGDQDGRDNNRNGVIDEAGERLGMESFSCFFKSGGTYGEPQTGAEFYNCLQGRWRNGDPILVGGDGTGDLVSSTDTTRFLFTGDPIANSFWTMENMDPAGNTYNPFDTRFIMGSGPFTMQPGDAQEFTMAVVWARGTDRLDSVRKLKEIAASLHDTAPALLHPNTALLLADEPLPDRTQVLVPTDNHPNPFTRTTTIRYTLPQPMHVRLTVYDALGRAITTLVDGQQLSSEYKVDFDAMGLPNGLYFYRIETGHFSTTRSMLLVR